MRTLPTSSTISLNGEIWIPTGGEIAVLVAPWRPFTINMERKWNRFERSEKVKIWREFGCYWARQLRAGAEPPLMPAAIIEAFPRVRRDKSQDSGGCMPTVKAVIDGLVDGGLLAGDSPDYVLRTDLWAPTFIDTMPNTAQKEELELRIHPYRRQEEWEVI